MSFHTLKRCRRQSVETKVSGYRAMRHLRVLFSQISRGLIGHCIIDRSKDTSLNSLSVMMAQFHRRILVQEFSANENSILCHSRHGRIDDVLIKLDIENPFQLLSDLILYFHSEDSSHDVNLKHFSLFSGRSLRIVKYSANNDKNNHILKKLIFLHSAADSDGINVQIAIHFAKRTSSQK